MAAVWKTLMRRKIIQQPEETSLGRVLGAWDLTFLGVGATLGIGLYVLVGKVAKETAGPSIVLSFLIAAIASAFAGLCYAEFGARVPRAGSAYVYSYVCIGEIVAFVIGWNLILEYVIGSASVAHGMSLYIDSITNDTLRDHFIDIAPIHVRFLAKYFDFFAFGVAIILATGLALGVKECSFLNNIITMLNILVVLFVFVAGGMKADWKNWRLQGDPKNDEVGTGGFFPFGVTGMIKGAATCFYGFVGFDCIATTGEEARNPRKAIPIAILTSLGISLIAYCGTSAVVTLMVPYYDQDTDSPLPFAFEVYDMVVAKWIVTVGGLCALSASLFGAMFPLPRIIYAMANDGLIFRFLGTVNARFATPLVGTVIAGILTGILAGLFEQGQLIDMMSIGTLLAYTIVAACVLILRYSVNIGKVIRQDVDEDGDFLREDGWLSVLANRGCHKRPTARSELLVTIQVGVFCILAVLAGACAQFLPDAIGRGEAYAIALPSIVAVCMLVLVTSMCLQPQNDANLSFKVPLVPVIPCLSILINIYLMMALDVSTWIRFGVWMAIGLPIYCCASRACCGKQGDTMAIGCAKNRNLSEGSTYVNFGFLPGEGEEQLKEDAAELEGRRTIQLAAVNLENNGDRETVEEQHQQQESKSNADSDSGAYFEENDAEPECEVNDNLGGNSALAKYENVVIVEPGGEEIEDKSVQDALGTLDNMLEKEEEKCGDFNHLGVPRFRNRSVSIVSSVSNNSNNLPMELSVVAIVHHEGEQESILEEIETSEDAEETSSANDADVLNEAKNIKLIDNHLIEYNEEAPPPPPAPPIRIQHEATPSSPPQIEDAEVEEDKTSNTIPRPPPTPPPDFYQPGDKSETKALAPPPPPPSMSQFELYKSDSGPKTPATNDILAALSTLKKSKRPVTPPASETSTPLGRRRLTPAKSETDLFTPSDDNIKLTSKNIDLFKSKLAADLGHMPKNLKFSVGAAPAAPMYHSLDRRPAAKKAPREEGVPKSESVDAINLSVRRESKDLEGKRKNSGVVDESLKEVDMSAIKERLKKLYDNRGSAEQGVQGYIKRRKAAEEEKAEFGESGV